MQKTFKFYLVLALLFILSGCGHDSGRGGSDPLLPLPGAVAEPDEAQMRDSVRKFITESGAPPSSMYKFTRADLNGDRRREAIILFQNPYGYWCGFYGCALLVLEAHDTDFTALPLIKPVQDPVYISNEKTNGWRDLLIHVSGRWTQTKDVSLQYDGRAYPARPETLPALVSHKDGQRIFQD